MRNEQKVKRDGYLNFLGGVDSGRSPNTLSQIQSAFAINVSFRGGYADTRPGFKLRQLTFNNSEIEDWFKDYIIQGAKIHDNSLVCSVGGRILRIDLLNDYEVSEITPSTTTNTTVVALSPPIGVSVTFTVGDASRVQVGLTIFVLDGYYTVTATTATTITATNLDATPGVNIPVGTAVRYLDPNPPNRPFAYMERAEEYLIIQDGISRAIIYVNGTARRSVPSAREVPTGTVMAYGHGRLWVATSTRDFVAGDINNGPSSVINFTENLYIDTGGAFRVPSDAGNITGMRFISNLDQSFGQGPLQVFTENSVIGCNTPVDRDTWQNLQNPILTQSMADDGATGFRSIVNVNGDIFYRSKEGVRSFILARRDFQSWGNTPISDELARVTEEDEENLLGFCSAVTFDNRMLFTCLPRRHSGITAYHNGIGVLDFKPLASIGQKAPPVWNGVWTGLKVVLMVTGTVDNAKRCFVFAINSSGENEIWELTKHDEFDGDGGRIQSTLETRGMIHENPFEMNRLYGAELWYDNVRGTVDWEIKYKPDQYPCWFDWKEWEACQTARDCTDPTDCGGPTEYKPGYRTRQSICQPSAVCETSDNKPSDLGYEFQMKLKWTGKARVKKLLCKVIEVEEEANGNLV